MHSPDVLAENVEWRREDIRHATLQIVGFYAHNNLNPSSAYWWFRYAQGISQAVRGETTPRQCVMTEDYFELVFHPPRPSLTPHVRNGLVVWEESEPKLVFHDLTYGNLLPSQRSYVYQVNEAIAEEVVDVYKLRIDYDPLSFVFPKEEYGEVNIIGRPTLIGER